MTSPIPILLFIKKIKNKIAGHGHWLPLLPEVVMWPLEAMARGPAIIPSGHGVHQEQLANSKRLLFFATGSGS